MAECSGDNILTVKDGELATPPQTAGILLGITRGVVIELAQKSGIRVRERDIIRYDLFTADECFLTGTAAEVIPVVKIDGRTIGSGKPGSMTLKLLGMFKKLVNDGE